MENPIPILCGDYPDLTLVRVGSDYYLTHSTNVYAPSLLIWHSHDLMNWRPVVSALPGGDGDVWAPDLSYHDGRFYIYYTATGRNKVVHADRIEGPWSEPIDLNVPHIDPCYVLGDPVPDGGEQPHWLFLSGGHLVRLTRDGLATIGAAKKVYDGWPIPADWRIEGEAEEGPKLFWREGWCYLITAQGGTAGPATGHMAVAARSRSVAGPWENSPYNPLLRTESREDRWYSKGHATLFDTPEGDWWAVYHAYDKGYWTLGRHTLIERIAWTEDSWPVLAETPVLLAAMPPLSDDFASPNLGYQWRFFRGTNAGRCEIKDAALRLYGRGESIASGSDPLCCLPQDQSYEVEVDVELEGDATAALVLWYDERCLTGLGLNGLGVLFLHHTHQSLFLRRLTRRARLRLVNDHQEVEFWVLLPGEEWQKLALGLEVSGWQHNTLGGFLGLRIGLTVSGSSSARFRDFRYQRLEEGFQENWDRQI